jgi:hypothetical protein
MLGDLNINRMGTQETEVKESKQFIRQCPVNECKGYLEKSLKCGLCDITACGACREVKEDNHKCDQGVVETIKLLSKDTKPCPKCGVMIMKIEGCDQMYCYPLSGGCGTAFSWRSLNIARGLIHNPHYYEYQRITKGSVDRQPGDVPGGFNQCLDLQQRHVNTLYDFFNAERRVIVRSFLEIREKYQGEYDESRFLRMNKDSRIEYLRDIITKEKLEWIVQRRDKQKQKEIEIHNVMNLFIISMTTLFFRLISYYDQRFYELYNPLDKQNVQDVLNEMRTLREYINTELHEIGKSYCNKSLLLNEDFKLVSSN